MRRDQLEHIIRAAADVTKKQHFIIIGSQAILAQYPDAPEELLISMEADLYPPEAPELSDFIDGALGRGSLFQKTHGIEADGVSTKTASLPKDWAQRLTPIRNENTNNATGWCVDIQDIAIAKYAAGREKDLRYTAALWKHGMVDRETLDERLRNTELKATDKPREWIEQTLRRQQHEHESAGRGRSLTGRGRSQGRGRRGGEIDRRIRGSGAAELARRFEPPKEKKAEGGDQTRGKAARDRTD